MTVPPGRSPLIHLLDAAEVGTAILGPDRRFLYVSDWMAAVNGVPPEHHEGREVAEVLPDLAPSLNPLIETVMRTGERVLSTVITGSTAATRDRHWQASYLPLDTDAGRAVGVVLIDVTDRVAATDEAQRRVRQQTLVADLGRRALETRAVGDLLDDVCRLVKQELGADLSGVMFRSPEEGDLVMHAGAGWPPGAMGGPVRAALGRGSQAGFSLESAGPVIMSDATTEDRFEISPLMLAKGVRSAISTPIPGEPDAIGVFGVMSCRPGSYDEDDAGFVEAVGNILGSAIRNERQRTELERLAAQRGRLVAQALEAAEREQREMAEILHDDVLQHLLSARLELSGGDPASLERVGASVGRAADLVRTVTASLHPVTLAHGGLGVAVERVAADHRRRGGIDIATRIDAAAEGRHDRLLISLVRELLNNVVRHADASRCEVSATVDAAGDTVLSVTDDGLGLPVETDSADRLGLAYARERVGALGGLLTTATGSDGRGTRVTVRLPPA